MCHTSVLEWAPTVLGPAEVGGKRVLEVGSYNVNGSVRPLVERHGPAEYLGVDQRAGPGVDREVGALDLVAVLGSARWDVVIATELLEHVADWAGCVAAMVESLVDGGLLVLSTRSVGFPYHPFPGDFWRFSVDGTDRVLRCAGLVDVKVDEDPQAPGVFATARRPAGWRRPWSQRHPPGEVLANKGVTVVVVR